MAVNHLLDTYRRYLEAVENEAPQVSAEEYEGLLSPGEVDDLCLIRDMLAAASSARDRATPQA